MPELLLNVVEFPLRSAAGVDVAEVVNPYLPHLAGYAAGAPTSLCLTPWGGRGAGGMGAFANSEMMQIVLRSKVEFALPVSDCAEARHSSCVAGFLGREAQLVA